MPANIYQYKTRTKTLDDLSIKRVYTQVVLCSEEQRIPTGDWEEQYITFRKKDEKKDRYNEYYIYHGKDNNYIVTLDSAIEYIPRKEMRNYLNQIISEAQTETIVKMLRRKR